MSMLIPRLALGTFLWLSFSGPAFACADPPQAHFEDMVTTAPTTFVFQLVSATYALESLGGGASTERVEGEIRVVDSIKGTGASFSKITYNSRSCGGVRMNVGQFYLVSTTQEGPVLSVWGADQAVLDLTLDHYNERSKRSPTVDAVREIVAGMSIPDGFPREEIEMYMQLYPPPPPPPGAGE